MQLRTNYDESVWDLGPDQPGAEWLPSPLPGVSRYPLDRDGEEVAVATSLVRYAPGSDFDPHQHALGEEYLVLEGEFADNHGRYPVGTYVRNPAGTAHKPFSDPGCLIWVKLRQFHPDDQRQFEIPLDLVPLSAGLQEQPLHDFAHPDPQDADEGAMRERVSLWRMAAGESIELPAAYSPQEVFVIDGEVSWQDAQTVTLGRYGWLRLSPGQPLRLSAATASAFLWKERALWSIATHQDVNPGN